MTDRRLPRVPRAGASGRAPARPCSARRRSGSMRRCAPTTSRRGASARATAASRGRGSGAALATTSLPFGVVNAPGQRYHPAIIAQASATLAAMFPGRFWVALGSGEAVNEHITGDRWPPKPERQARLLECVEVIRALHAGEEVTHHGLVHVDRARDLVAPGGAAGAGRRGGVRRDRRVVRVVGRRADHGQPAASRRFGASSTPTASAGGRGQRRAPGARVLRRRRARRPSRSPTTSGATARSDRRSAGTRTRWRPSTP